MTDEEPGLKAYVIENVADDERRRSYVVFARNGRAARRGAWIDDAEFVNIRARRKPEWDHYAPGPVPLRVRLDDGWWTECGGCARVLRYTSDRPAMVIDETVGQAWCDERCHAREEGWLRGRAFFHAERAAEAIHA